MNKCKWCLLEFNTQDKPKGWMANHTRWCDKNVNASVIAEKSSIHLKECRELAKESLRRTGFTNQYVKAKMLRLETPKYPPRVGRPGKKHSPESKQKMSEKRKKYLSDNPDKHVWKRHAKFKSVPCEKLKLWLTSKNISFEPEYSKHSVPDRFFAIDIALVDKRIALEVNGNQHYNRDGSLKDYYKERETLLTSAGWTVIQIPYSVCHNISKIEELFKTVIGVPGGKKYITKL